MTPIDPRKGRKGQSEAIKSYQINAPLPLIRDTRLKDKDVRAWLYIKSRLSADLCDLSADRIARAIGCKSTAVENSLKRLIVTGWLGRSKRPKSKLYDYSTRTPENDKAAESQTKAQPQLPKNSARYL